MTVEPDIEVEDLSVTYSNADGSAKRAIQGVSLQVYPGEIVSLVGPSGCGKTTILRAILGDVEHKGTCHINVRREVDLCYLEQSPVLLPWRTALENAALGQEIRGHLTKDSIVRVEELLSDFGLDIQSRDAFPAELSVGMQQRVSIARALEASPKVLLCDEPFSAIDFITRLKLNRIFRRRCSSKVSVLLVTHNIDEAIFLSTRVCVMSGTPGGVVAVVEPRFKDWLDDPVVMRERPEFEGYFNAIWVAMGMHG
jgi:NitT/TauT family transport system ATP-binding protein